MGIPIIGEIWDGIRWIIDFFFTKAPRPLQILVFLLMLLLFSNVLLSTLHLIGIHCNQGKEVVTTSFFDVSTNLWVFYDTTIKQRFTTPTVSYGTAHPYVKWTLGALSDNDCIYFLTNKTGTLTFCDSPNDSTCRYYYREQPEGVGIIKEGCVVCNYSDVGKIYAPNKPLNWVSVGEICTDDVYPKEEGTSWWTSFFNCAINCQIPEHYYFDFETGQYICKDLEYCGVNATEEPVYEFQSKLKNANAELLYADTENKSISKMVYLQCDAQYNPRLTLFGIDVFDYKIWVLLFIIAIMIYGLTHLGQQNRL